LGRGLSLLIFGKIIAKIANLGSKKAGLSSNFLGKFHDFQSGKGLLSESVI
jgi:hypothetical protein